MLAGSVFSKQYWIEAVATACYTQNRYPLYEYLHRYEPSQRYQTNRNDVSFIEPYEKPELVVLETQVSSDQNDQTNQNDHNDKNDHSAQTDEIFNDAQSDHSNHNNDNPIIDNLTNTKDVQNPEPTSSLVEDTSVSNTILIQTGDLGAEMLTRAMANELSAASDHECLFVDFLSEEEPKKVFEALKNLGWVDAMQEELNQLVRNKVWTLVLAPYGKTIIGSKWVFRNKRDETGIVIETQGETCSSRLQSTRRDRL
ncbi:hypothetical protein Tco_0639622 [Tanacetum coccineum]